MMMDTFAIMVQPSFSIATVYCVSLYSVRVTHSSVCMSRAVPTMLITVTQLDPVTQESVLPREMVKRSHRAYI